MMTDELGKQRIAIMGLGAVSQMLMYGEPERCTSEMLALPWTVRQLAYFAQHAIKAMLRVVPASALRFSMGGDSSETEAGRERCSTSPLGRSLQRE